MKEIRTLTYAPWGTPVADHIAEEWSKKLKNHDLVVSTENVVIAFRSLLREGFFDICEVELVYVNSEGERYFAHLGEEGAINFGGNVPIDYYSNWFMRILGW